MEENLIKLFIVGILWGGSNPFLKQATNKKNKNVSIIYELYGYLSNWKYILAFIANQSGSLLFYYSLRDSDISMAIPIANGISLLSTSVIGTIIGEEKPKIKTMIGVLLLILGILCLIQDDMKK
ncbi:transmembrane protein 234 homolog isoform X2 [Daktulosphaira vitifoliae]|uniref:transmembrane protein 234 homolog isoform X2 n=1 Tax=Daktulosphaira vitifoliae TaxID=58002 RepID=UPI0021AAD312|nr:transmembrane protein 234 homolog isoform X2 [Daktulosphaira vitifoliae]